MARKVLWYSATPFSFLLSVFLLPSLPSLGLATIYLYVRIQPCLLRPVSPYTPLVLASGLPLVTSHRIVVSFSCFPLGLHTLWGKLFVRTLFPVFI